MDKTIAGGMLVALIFTALAFGANEAWSVGLFELLMTLLLLLWAVKWVADQAIKVTVPAAVWPLAALCAFGFVQSLTLSLDREATRGATTAIFFMLVAFLLAANFFATRERLSLLVNLLVAYGLALAVFALVQSFTFDGKIYWVRPTPFAAFGPFPNRNHYAGYMEMLAPLPFALIAARAVRRQSWLFYSFAGVLMVVSVFASLSRGGMMSVVAGIAFVAMLSSRVKPRRAGGRVRDARLVPTRFERAMTLGKRLAGAAVIAVVIAIGVFWIGAEGLINRAAESIDQMKTEAQTPGDFYSRREIWRDTWQMIRAHPVAGIGLGAYNTVFPNYARHDGHYKVDYAHNDYLQVLSDGGVIAALLALSFIVLIGRAVWRATRAEDPLEAGLALGCGAGLFALLIHSAFDFNLQIPANALLFVFLSALVSRIAATVTERKPAAQAARAARLEAAGLSTGVSS
ncbi:MAG TPA: O-antigen ligase family protein [Blastocatellia bacterium]|nr:O-antigen ligase family protein [Blastocatellia bacterium]